MNNQENFSVSSHRERLRQLSGLSRHFLVESPQQHQEVLTHMGLENFCLDPCFSNLRNNMRELVEMLAAVAAGLPGQHYGFYRLEKRSSFYTYRICFFVFRLVWG